MLGMWKKQRSSSHVHQQRVSSSETLWFDHKINKTKWYTERLISIVLVQMHFIQCKQFSETNVTLHVFQEISDLKIFPECFAGNWKHCGGAHVAHGLVVGPHCLFTKGFYTHPCICVCGNLRMFKRTNERGNQLCVLCSLHGLTRQHC